MSRSIPFPVPTDNRIELMHIADTTAHQQWEKLLGHALKTDAVKVTREFYLKNMHAIHAIQMGSALRRQRH